MTFTPEQIRHAEEVLFGPPDDRDCFQCGEPLDHPDELICTRCAENALHEAVQ